MGASLPPRQQQVLDFVLEYVSQYEYPPSLRHLGYRWQRRYNSAVSAGRWSDT